jgi:hypothetical protein
MLRGVHLETEHVGLAHAPAASPAREPLEGVVLEHIAVEHEGNAQGHDRERDPMQAQRRQTDDHTEGKGGRDPHCNRDEIVGVKARDHHARGVCADPGERCLAE